jgi:methionyl-tRNA synthetase
MGTKRILVTSALPYANGSIHLGHLVEYVQTDVFVRFLRLVGDDAIYVCADDTHGTPIEMRASQEGIAPEELVARYHEEHQKDFKDFDIKFDFYGSTHQEENRRWAEQIFTNLQKAGLVYEKEIEQLYSVAAQRFLPDRYVRGTCPKCGAEDQYGDSCEKCNSTYRPTDLVNPRCAITGTTPELRRSSHFFVRIAHYADALSEWVASPGRLQPETRNFVEAWLKEGLRDWDISRDPPYFGFTIPGTADKYFYVWLDAPIGYVSTTDRWCQANGRDVEADYWRAGDDEVEIHHFIGKDIVYFHTLFWPAMLMASELRLPDAIHVHGFLKVDGEKMSKTRGTFINARTYLDHLDPQYLRYYFSSKLSGRAEDLDLSFEDFVNRVNAELVNKIVNLASRSIQFVSKRLDGRLGTVPADGRELLDSLLARLPDVEAAYRKVDYATALRIACEVAEQGNLYFQQQAPFHAIKTDAEAARGICTTAVNVCRIVAAIVAPVVPSLAERIFAMLQSPLRWSELATPLENTAIGPFQRLLDRVDAKAIDRIIEASKETKEEPDEAPDLEPETDYESFMKTDLRVARVVKAETVKKSKKLLRLTLDVGPLGERNVLSGIRLSYPEPERLEGKKVVLVANLAPRKMMGELSQGMVLAAGGSDDQVRLVELPADTPPGDRVK